MPGIKIETYSDANFSKKGKTWQGAYDPGQLELEYSNRFWEAKAIGISPPATYAGQEQKNMIFPLLFDHAWVPASGSDKEPPSIKKQVEEFIKLVYEVNSESHTLNYLQVSLGDFIFHGQCQSLKVNYPLLGAESEPLRAMVYLNMLETESIGNKKAKAGLKSPDLTRSLLVKEGDSLAGISQKFFNTPRYYLELARINGISNFRNLRPGTRIVVPPLNN